jgi:hypothetical protein
MLDLATWDAFALAVQNFHGNPRTENYAELVSNILIAQLNCWMSLRIHSSAFFPPNLGDMSEEHLERFQ